MTTDKFIEIINQTLETLPAEFGNNLRNVEIVVEDVPTDEQKRKLKLSPFASLYGLYEGVPQNIPGEDKAYLPDKITIFRLPILERHDSEEAVIEQIKSTLLHEIGHFFGMSEDQLKKY